MIYNEIMKKMMISLLSILLIFLTFASCQKNSPSPVSTVSESPKETTAPAAVEEVKTVAESTSKEFEEEKENPASEKPEPTTDAKEEETVVVKELPGEFGKLDVQDYFGNRVTANLFTEYDVTMVNIFTSWCTWCIKELPDMVKLSKEMPEGSKLIAICADAFDAPEALKEIVEQYNIDFPILIMTENQVRDIHYIIGYPTTFYVGRNAEILDQSIGMPAEGVSGYRAKVEQLLAK